MIVRLEKYVGEYRIVSLASETSVKDDLLDDGLDVIYVTEKSVRLYPGNEVVSENKHIIELLQQAHNYDVFELWEDGKLVEYYDDSSLDNYFFVTSKCNSNCVMCPSPDLFQKSGENTGVETLIEIARHIPEDAPHLTITGGEPFMIGKDIFRFMEFLRDKFEYTEFLLLTNGRVFALDAYTHRFKETAPENIIVAIPVHGSSKQIHDSITQVDGSFEQTIQGIKKLLKVGVRVEIRIVVNKMNAADIFDIARLICDELSSIEYVSIMAMEMTGSARLNMDKVWIPYREAAKAIEEAAILLLEHEIDVKLYNFPLCTVKNNLWTLCEKSISPDKVRYSDVCSHCKMRKSCGGVFAGTISIEKGELKAIV